MNSPLFLHVYQAHRRIKVNENRAGDVFAAAGLAEEGLVGSTFTDFFGLLGINTTVRLEAVLKQVPGINHKVCEWDCGWRSCEVGYGEGKAVRTYSSQALLPSWAPAWPI